MPDTSLANTSLPQYLQTDSAISAPVFEEIIQVNPYINLYHGHELKATHSAPIEINDTKPDWFFLILVLVIALLAYMRVAYTKFLNQMISAVFNNHLTNQIVRDESLLVQRASVILSVLYNVVAALLLYIISVHYDWSFGIIGSGFLRFLFMALLVSIALATKFVVLKICGYLFNHDKETASYIFNIFLINNLLGIMLIPFIALMAFSQAISLSILVKLAVILLIITYLYRLYRGFLIGLKSQSFSPFYLFLYLCALEIAPLSVLIKLIAKQ